LVDVATGVVLDDEDATFRIEASLRLVEGEWRVVAVESVQKWEGIVACDG
jgi:hypothetical protein